MGMGGGLGTAGGAAAVCPPPLHGDAERVAAVCSLGGRGGAREMDEGKRAWDGSGEIALAPEAGRAGVRVGVELVARRPAAPCGLVAALEGLPVEAARGVQLGSSDPHMLREPGEVAEARREPYRGTFSLDRLDPADERELRVRPRPELNPVPRTNARDEPKEQPQGAPVVSSVEQVVPRETLRRIGRWQRRVKASLKAARRGSLHLARMLRPDDLELRTSEHTVSGAEGWIWDLRPLASGECAVPLKCSSLSVAPATDLDLAAVARLGAEYDDKAIISEMLMGFSDDAVAVETHVVLSPPHLGALRYAKEAREKIDKDVGQGWSEIVSELPFWPVRVNPYSIVREDRGPRVKHRMTIDLSWPRASEGREAVSVNESIDRSEWVQSRMLRVSQLAESVAILRSSGAPVRLWSLDCVSYYRKTGRQKGEIWRNCVMAECGFVVDEREQFGDASAAVKCVRQSSFLAWLIRRALRAVDMEFPTRHPLAARWLEERRAARCDDTDGARLGFGGMYVDDVGGASIDDELVDVDGLAARNHGPDELGAKGEFRGSPMRRAMAHFYAARAALRETGEESEASKEVLPCEKLDLLGMELDIEGEGRMRLSMSKRIRYAARVEGVLALGSACGREDFEALLHRLLFASFAMPEGRQFLNPLFRVAKARFRLSGDRVCITARVRKALAWWREHLGAAHEGVPLACRGVFPLAGEESVAVMYSDASGGFGFGGWTIWSGRVFYVADEWTAEEREGIHINVKELLAMTAALVTFVPKLQARYALEFTDNTVAEGAARRTTPSSAPLQQLVARRVEWLRGRGAFSAVARVGTKENLWADLLSRKGGEAVFLAQARGLGLEPVRLLVAEEWRETAALLRGGGDPEIAE